jgi:hypothetical protein
MGWRSGRSALVLVLLVLGGCAREGADAPPRVEPAEPTGAVETGRAAPPLVEVLRAWDAERADAWARSDSRRLASLYAPSSGAGRRDVAMLRAWSSRGLVVQGLRTQLLAVRELSRSRSTWTLRVTDRLVGGVAVGAGVRRPLPVDAATTRTVVLRRLDGVWRVASVT